MQEIKDYIHLHVHSHYSLLDGHASIKSLVDIAKADGQRGIALTDHGAMFGVKEFFDYVDNEVNGSLLNKIKGLKKDLTNASEEGNEEKRVKCQSEIEELEAQLFKPIIGCECYCARRGRLSKDKNEKSDRSGYHLVVLAKNAVGYKNLIKMVSRSYTEGFYAKPRIDKELLQEYHEGLIVLSACLGGEIPVLLRNGDYEGAKASALWFKELFGDDYYLELQRHKATRPNANHTTYPLQVEVNEQMVRLAEETGIKLIVTNDVHFAQESDAEMHDMLVCMNTGKFYDDTDRIFYSKQEWLKSKAEMSQLFADFPQALDATMEVWGKVEHYTINHEPLMPDFPLPEGFTDENEYLHHLSYKGAHMRYGKELSQEVVDRLEFELGTIKRMGFPGYFLIVQDFIVEARRRGISVGPGRGSAAGSVVAYCLTITNLDPLKYDLLFERFLDPGRISLPDIDVDFDDEGRFEILQWVTEKYGHEKVAHVVTFQTMAAKSSIKDAARMLRLPLPESNALAELIPAKIPDVKCVTIAESMKMVPELKAVYHGPDKNKRRVLDFAMGVEGCVRGTGVHACGIIIGREDLSNFVPMFTTKNVATGEEILVTQYEGTVIEATGLIKMDFLGLKTLSIIRETLLNIKKRHGIEVDIDNISLEDPEVYRLFCEGRASAIFQFESGGMQSAMMQLKPSRFEDLIAMNALYRPGPMDYIPLFIKRKHGEEPISYDLPQMERYLASTYGVTVYQEQVMLLSRELAGFTPSESDQLRKAMGKKLVDKLPKLKAMFLKGGLAKGHPEEKLEKIWSDWEKFAKYAFNKSHSTCYSWLAYQTAYLKAHYPSEFMAGVLSRNIKNAVEVKKYLEECRAMGIEVLCPDVNESDLIFSVNSKGNVRLGLNAIKGMPRSAAAHIVEVRGDTPFVDVFDFFERINVRICTKKVLDSLVLAGAFDSLDHFSREDFFVEESEGVTFLDQLIQYAQRIESERNSSMISLFGEAESKAMKRPLLKNTSSPWSQMERLNKEKELLGLYLTATPFDKYPLVFTHYCNFPVNMLDKTEEYVGKTIIFGGMVVGVRNLLTKAGAPMSILKLQDINGEGEILLVGKAYERYAMYAREGLFLIVHAIPEKNQKTNKIYNTILKCELLDSVYEGLFSSLDVHIPYYFGDEIDDSVEAELAEAPIVEEVAEAEYKLSPTLDTLASVLEPYVDKPGNIALSLFLMDPQRGFSVQVSNDQMRAVAVDDTLLDTLNMIDGIKWHLN